MKDPILNANEWTFGVRGNRLSRRAMLRGAGVAIALPAMECMLPAQTASPNQSPRRMVAINFELSFHPPNLIPEKAGRDYEAPPYLKQLQDLRQDFTVISGTSHPDVDGYHSAVSSWLSCAPHPAAANFRNSISMDQVAARQIGLQTRFAYLALGSSRISISAQGVGIMPNAFASRVFSDMFLESRAQQKRAQERRLREGRSVLDLVLDSAKRMRARMSAADREKLDEYFGAVREAERQLAKSQDWAERPKPGVDAKPPRPINDRNDIIARAKQFYDMMYLAILTDSTRIMTFGVGDSNSTATLPGVTMAYHNLSHHGKDPEKLKQLGIVENAHVSLYGDFLRRLKETKEGDSNLLAQTDVLMGSHMHSGLHRNTNLPIILAGGSFKHGRHLKFDHDNNYPLANLYVNMLQSMGLETDKFASSTGTMRGIETA